VAREGWTAGGELPAPCRTNRAGRWATRTETNGRWLAELRSVRRTRGFYRDGSAMAKGESSVVVRIPPVSIGLTVPVLVECEPDKSNRHQDSASYHQPVWILQR
jgi:hypothetical protein